MQLTFALQGISQKERERERDGHGDPSLWWNKGALLNSVWVYIPYYKVASSDKGQKTRLYKLPRKQGAMEAIRPKGNPYQKRVIDNPFHHMERLVKEILCKHPISMISVLGVACHPSWSWQELIRNRGLKRDRKQHTGILLLNIPWQIPLFYYICKKGPERLSLFSFNNFFRMATVNNKYNYQDNRQSYSSRPDAVGNALKPSSWV